VAKSEVTLFALFAWFGRLAVAAATLFQHSTSAPETAAPDTLKLHTELANVTFLDSP